MEGLGKWQGASTKVAMTDETEDEFVDPLNVEVDSPGACLRDPRCISMYAQLHSVHESIRMHDGSSILFELAQHGDSGLLDYLKPLDEGMLNTVGAYRTYDGSTPLWWAARNGHYTSVEILLHGAPEHFAYGPGGVTPLMIASMYGHDEVVQLLCQRLSLNDVDLGGNTAVHYAARYGEEAVLKHLVGVGADCTVQNYCGETPEQLAREAGFDNCVVMLQEFRMFFPLWAAVGMGDVADLKKRGKLPKDMEHPVTGETLLHWAARRPDVAMLRYLLDQGLPAHRADKWNRTPLWYAVARGNLQAVKLLLSTGSVQADMAVALKALALYGENSDMHEVLLAHAARRQKQTEKARMRYYIMLSMRVKTPAQYALYVQVLKQEGYSQAEIDELLEEASNIEMADLMKLASEEQEGLAWASTDQNEEFSGSEDMQDCIGSLEEEDLSTAALKRDPKKETIPDELATSEGGKEETEAEKKRRKKAKKAKMKERQRSKQQGAEGKDRDEEGEEDDAEEDAEEKRGAQKDDEAATGATAGATAKKKKKNKKKKNTAAAAEDGADLEAELSRDHPAYHDVYRDMFKDSVDDGDFLLQLQRRVEAMQLDETFLAAAEDSSVGPPPAGARAQIEGWSMGEGVYRHMNTGQLQADELHHSGAGYDENEGEELTPDEDPNETWLLHALWGAQKQELERREGVTTDRGLEGIAPELELERIEKAAEKELEEIARLLEGQREFPRSLASYGNARPKEPYAVGYGRRDDDDDDYDFTQPKSLYQEHKQRKKQESGQMETRGALSAVPQTHRLEIHDIIDDSDDMGVSDDIDESDDDGETDSRGTWSSEDEAGPSAALSNNEAERLAEKRAEKNRKKKERRRKAKAMQQGNQTDRPGIREQDEEELDTDDMVEERRYALLGGGGGMFRAGWRGLLGR